MRSSARAKPAWTPQTLREFFDGALVSPVLTAHPTEVRRKSTLTRELEVAGLIDERERLAGDDAELQRNEERLRRAVLLLWRTSLLRHTRLRVIDEVSNGLSYYDYTFFPELPRLYAQIEDELDHEAPASAGGQSAHSCASARGSAATATATPMSRPECSRRRCGCKARGRCSIISKSCTSSAASFR